MEVYDFETRQVCALSTAEMPVEMYSLASIETGNAVLNKDLLSATMSGLPSLSTISLAIGGHEGNGSGSVLTPCGEAQKPEPTRLHLDDERPCR